ncbi:hypothetical protein [Nocardia jinanensis]|uniref:Uncharacterized protein n=1 Tax=Nocardia jinanensis TaxID=382504 RepID=A0A917RNV8_9NOCA|nr:hypothetical protein [Nocardia jinanensis]GGL15892.1 hypothetical protein GCM10011588_33200 [Nocardia jinanensis]
MNNQRTQLWCAMAGPAAIGIALVGWLIAGILPKPPAADLPTAELVRFYADNPAAVRTGLTISIFGISGIGVLTAAITVHLLAAEGRSPVLCFTQMVAGTVTWVLLVVPLVIMNVAAFRPDRSPELTVLLNDLAWILFIPPVAPFVVQNVAIAVVILRDRAERPILPRWVAYANLWVAFLFLPGVLSYFFKSGPFAWQGLFSFWLALSAYTAWALIMGFSLRSALRAQHGPEPAPAA